LVGDYGYIDERGRKAFSVTLTNTPNNRGFFYKKNRDTLSLHCDLNHADKSDWSDNLSIKYGRTPVVESFYDMSDIRASIDSKLHNVVLAYYDKQAIDGVNFVRYSRIIIYENLDVKSLEKYFTKGKIKIDFRARAGKNHGTAFRIQRNDLPNLWKNVTVIEG